MKAFKICYVSPEVEPFARSTASNGLAHTSSALPVALKDFEQDVRLMMPKYKSINERKYVLREVIRLREVSVPMGSGEKIATGKTAFLPNSKVHVYFLSVPEYFDRKGYYSDPKSGKDYADNAERFGYFCKSVLETLKLLYWQPDIIHCCHWSTALIPFYLKTHYSNDPFFKNTRTLLTIHNLALQGELPLESASALNIDPTYITPGGALEKDGHLNFLKAGLSFADLINFTSKSRHKQLLEKEELTYGLSELLQKRRKEIFGVANGVDYHTWDPENDKLLTAQFTTRQINKRSENRHSLAEESGLELSENSCLVGILMDFSDKEALKIVSQAIPELIKKNTSLLALNTGDFQEVDAFNDFENKHPGKFNKRERFDRRTMHLLLGGADIMFLPAETSLGEQLHLSSLRYGAVPVVPNSNIIVDTIREFSLETGKGNGLLFEEGSARSAVSALKNALTMHAKEETWIRIQKNGMKADFSWKNTAQNYMKLYERAMK